MNTTLLDQIVNAVLYEGYILYPYRASSAKNQRERFTFGRVYPQAYSEAQNGAEPCVMQTEGVLHCLANSPMLRVSVRCLQPMWREIGSLAKPLAELPKTEPSFEIVPNLAIGEKFYQTWQEATERQVNLSLLPLDSSPRRIQFPFSFPALRSIEPILNGDGHVAAVMLRRQEAIEGVIEVEIRAMETDYFRITVRILNQSPISAAELSQADSVLMKTMASAHTILHIENGEFLSLAEAPKHLAILCNNIGTWPVLVGDEAKNERDTMLSSPIILYDYPKIAPESGGSFFDGLEIDQMLTLRVMTMTDEEKREMRADDFTRRILERTEATNAEDFLKLHGTLREVKPAGSIAEDFFNPVKPLKSVLVSGIELRKGDRVRIRPRKRADAIDLLLAGKTAVIEAVEQDAEENIHLAVVLDDDPGHDLGLLRQPGHRFFYSPDEIEPLEVAV